MPEVVLTGDDAVSVIALKYTWNVYVPDYGLLKVLAYPKTRDIDGFFSTDFSEKSEIAFTLPMSISHSKLLAVLLDDHQWDEKSWLEHDDWLDADTVVKAYGTDWLFADWFEENVKDYIPPIVVA